MRGCSSEVWILAANRMMEKALEVERWISVFAEHGVSIMPRLVSELRLIADGKGLRILDPCGDGLLSYFETANAANHGCFYTNEEFDGLM